MNFDKQGSHRALTKTKNAAENKEESCIKVTILFLIKAQTLQFLSLSSPSHPPHIAQQNSRLEAPKLLLCIIQLEEEETVFFICVRKSEKQLSRVFMCIRAIETISFPPFSTVSKRLTYKKKKPQLPLVKWEALKRIMRFAFFSTSDYYSFHSHNFPFQLPAKLQLRNAQI